MSSELERLQARDHAVNAIQAVLLGVPFIGASLERFIFGGLQELRMRRIETTLHEVAESLRKRAATSDTASNEDFVGLLESVTPSLARATDEDRRRAFRNLLVNAGQVSPGNAAWEEARFVGRLLDEIDGPGLAILAVVAGHDGETWIVSHPSPQVHYDSYDYSQPRPPHHSLPYAWPLLEESMTRLVQMRLVSLGENNAKWGFGRVYLSPLGQLLARWTVDSNP